MLVGVMFGPSIAEYGALAGSAPATLIIPPVVFLSRPNEKITLEMSQKLADPDLDLIIRMKPTVFRNIYNARTSLTGFYAAMVPEKLSVDELRQKLGVKEPVPFIPFMLIVHDGMRSQSVRLFLRSLSDALSTRIFEFKVYVASNHIEEHLPLFDDFAEEAEDEFVSAEALLSSR